MNFALTTDTGIGYYLGITRLEGPMHDDWNIFTQRDGFMAFCSCGWRRFPSTLREALRLVRTHLRDVR